MGSDGDATRDAYDPGIAYDPLTEEYLVVWEGDNVTDGKWNIHGQLLDKYGSEIGDNDIYISSLNGLPNNDYSAINPSVALDTNNNEYFVVWQDDELGNGEYEVWGQNVNYNGDTLGPDVRLSDMGPDGDPDFDAQRPVVVYSDAKINQFLVVWDGDDFIDGEFEIWGQRFTNGWKTFLPVVMRN